MGLGFELDYGPKYLTESFDLKLDLLVIPPKPSLSGL